MLENIFSGLTVYGQSWVVEDSSKLTNAEKAMFSKCTVVKNQFDKLSACFFLKSGGMQYIPMDAYDSAQEGDELKLDELELVELSKPGEKNIIVVRSR